MSAARHPNITACLDLQDFAPDFLHALVLPRSRWLAFLRTLSASPLVRVPKQAEHLLSHQRSLVGAEAWSGDNNVGGADEQSEPDLDSAGAVREGLERLKEKVRRNDIRLWRQEEHEAVQPESFVPVRCEGWEEAIASVPTATVVRASADYILSLFGPLHQVYDRVEIVDPGFRNPDNLLRLLAIWSADAGKVRQVVVYCSPDRRVATSGHESAMIGCEQLACSVRESLAKHLVPAGQEEEPGVVNVKYQIRVRDDSAHDRAVAFSMQAIGNEQAYVLGLGNPIESFLHKGHGRACLVARLTHRDFEEIADPWIRGDSDGLNVTSVDLSIRPPCGST